VRILLVEDEDITREIYKSHLRPHCVHAFDNGLSGFQFFLEKKDSLDLIVSDHVMPFLNGLDLFRKVREISQSIPFLLITGSPLNGELKEFIEQGGTLVNKPIGLKKLINLVENYDSSEK
jgi:CheY-like chemotaxis protein